MKSSVLAESKLTKQDIDSIATNRFMRRYWVRLAIAWIIGLAMLIWTLYLPVGSTQAYITITISGIVLAITFAWYTFMQTRFTKRFKALYKSGELKGESNVMQS